MFAGMLNMPRRRGGERAPRRRSCMCNDCQAAICTGPSHISIKWLLQDQELYDQLPEPDDDENDMLDLAYGLTET